MYVKGYIKDLDQDSITIVAPFSDHQRLIKQQITECEIRLDDGRSISADQRKKIYATMRDISDYTGHTPEETKAWFKYDFIAKTGHDYFSLSDCSMTTANQYLEHIIEFCLTWDIPCSDNLIDRSPDIGRYVYMCLVHKKCCVTGQRTELHHYDAVGAGRDRKTIIHEGMLVLPLSRKYHAEAHTIGNKTFCEKYHIQPVRLDKYLCEIYKLRSAS